MVAYQPDHELGSTRVETQPVAGPPGGDGPVLELATVSTLAHIVQQHGQHQGFEIVDPMDNLA